MRRNHDTKISRGIFACREGQQGGRFARRTLAARRAVPRTRVLCSGVITRGARASAAIGVVAVAHPHDGDIILFARAETIDASQLESVIVGVQRPRKQRIQFGFNHHRGSGTRIAGRRLSGVRHFRRRRCGSRGSQVHTRFLRGRFRACRRNVGAFLGCIQIAVGAVTAGFRRRRDLTPDATGMFLVLQEPVVHEDAEEDHVFFRRQRLGEARRCVTLLASVGEFLTARFGRIAFAGAG